MPLDSLFVSADDRAVSDRGGRPAPPQKCAALGAGRGYRTQLSMASQEAWDYAQQLCSKRYILGGIVMGIAALLLIKAAPVESVVSLYVFTVVIGLFEVVAVILLIASVETSCASVMRRRPPPDLPFSSFLSP